MQCTEDHKSKEDAVECICNLSFPCIKQNSQISYLILHVKAQPLKVMATPQASSPTGKSGVIKHKVRRKGGEE